MAYQNGIQINRYANKMEHKKHLKLRSITKWFYQSGGMEHHSYETALVASQKEECQFQFCSPHSCNHCCETCTRSLDTLDKNYWKMAFAHKTVSDKKIYKRTTNRKFRYLVLEEALNGGSYKRVMSGWWD